MKYIVSRCKHCNIRFNARVSDVKKGHGKYCSHACNTASRRRPMVDRIWDNIKKGGEDECWEFQKYKNACGYGVITGDDNRKILAHRVAFISKNGKIPNGMNVLHSCDNPACCNPKHLSIGTQRDNVIDMIQKKRKVVVMGSSHYKSKLTEADVMAIREMHNNGVCSREIAKNYSVTNNNIDFIVFGRTWKHLLNA